MAKIPGEIINNTVEMTGIQTDISTTTIILVTTIPMLRVPLKTSLKICLKKAELTFKALKKVQI